MNRIGAIGGLALTLAALGAGQAGAVDIYATSLEDQRIVHVDTATNAVTTVNASPLGTTVDSLFFLNSNTLLYTGIGNGTLNSLNISTGATTTLVTGLSGPRDVVIDPGNSFAFVSDYNNARIVKVNLSNNTTSILTAGASTDGLTFDAAGNFYAVVNRNSIVQIDPVTGATINSISPNGFGNLDGLTYDAGGGKLWATDFNGGVLELPTNLSTFTDHALPACGQDGVAPDGAGNLFYASRCDFRIHSVDMSTLADTSLTFVNGLDDIAPIVGQGSQTGVPEPASIAIFGTALAGLALRRRRR